MSPEEITVRKLGTSQISTSLLHFDECICKANAEKSPTHHDANCALKYHKNSPHSPTLARGGGVRISIDKCSVTLSIKHVSLTLFF